MRRAHQAIVSAIAAIASHVLTASAARNRRRVAGDFGGMDYHAHAGRHEQQ